MKKQKQSSTHEMVTEFHQVFGHPVESAPLTPDIKQMRFRARFLLEEMSELIEAIGARHAKNKHLCRAVDLIDHARDQIEMANDYEFDDVDLVEVADALGDLDYITSGAALTFGIPLPQVVAEIHRSNMTKLGEDGQPIYNDEGKVVKGPGFEKPQLTPIIFPEDAKEVAE
jgi:predicted HAD superfamily Cof-like phosphohydrolase